MLVFNKVPDGKWLSMYDKLLLVRDKIFTMTNAQYNSFTYIQQSQVIDFIQMLANTTSTKYANGRKLKSRLNERAQKYRRLQK